MSWSETALRLVLAIIIGGAVGYEREFKNMPAGFRTNILVCVGACVVSMIQVQSIDQMLQLVQNSSALQNVYKADIGRMGAQVISGIGFLGAGVILHEKGSIKGLTTAASLWVVACIGLGVGLGYYYLSIISAISVVIVLRLKKYEDKFLEKNKLLRLEIKYRKRKDTAERLLNLLKNNNIRIRDIEFLVDDDMDDSYTTSSYTIIIPKCVNFENLIGKISEEDEVISVSIEE